MPPLHDLMLSVKQDYGYPALTTEAGRGGT